MPAQDTAIDIPEYSAYSFRELFEALEGIRGDLYPHALAALETEIRRRHDVSKAELEEAYFRLDKQKYPEHERHLRETIEGQGGFDTIAPETVTVENRFRTGWRRFWAWSFDGLLLQLVLGAATMPILKSRPDDIALAAIVNYIASFLSVFYYVVMHASLGQTVGKMITGVRVVRNADLQSINFSRALLRDLVPLIAVMVGLLLLPHVDIAIAEENGAAPQLPPLVVIVSLIALIWGLLEVLTMLFSKRRRAAHDFIAGTVVVRYLRRAAKQSGSEPRASDDTSGS